MLRRLIWPKYSEYEYVPPLKLARSSTSFQKKRPSAGSPSRKMNKFMNGWRSSRIALKMLSTRRDRSSWGSRNVS